MLPVLSEVAWVLLFVKCNRSLDLCLGVPEWTEAFYSSYPSWGILGEKKIPHKWMNSVHLLKNLWWFCHLWYSFCCRGKNFLNMLAFCFVSQICCGVSTSVAFMTLSHSSPTRPCKRSKNQPIRIVWAVQPQSMYEDDWGAQVSGGNSLTSPLRVWWTFPTAAWKWC